MLFHDSVDIYADILFKVRISLPPSRAAPKRTAAERKSIVDEQMTDDDDDNDDNDSTAGKKKSSPSKRGRPKKGNSPKGKAGKGNSKAAEEYEVQKIIDDEMRGGKKYYRIRWKGWGASSDTWEPKGIDRNFTPIWFILIFPHYSISIAVLSRTHQRI